MSTDHAVTTAASIHNPYVTKPEEDVKENRHRLVAAEGALSRIRHWSGRLRYPPLGRSWGVDARGSTDAGFFSWVLCWARAYPLISLPIGGNASTSCSVMFPVESSPMMNAPWANHRDAAEAFADWM